MLFSFDIAESEKFKLPMMNFGIVWKPLCAFQEDSK